MKNKSNYKVKINNLRNITLSIIGPIITAFAISIFYTPNKIVSGGVSGISTILYHLLKIEPGISFAVINAFFLLISFKVIGKEFVFKTIIGATLISVFVQLFSTFPPLQQANPNLVLLQYFR